MSRKVLITGASRGLGYELVKVYHSNNYDVFPLVRNEESAYKLSIEFPQKCFPIIADIGQDNCKDIIKTSLELHTKEIDIIINNAGVSGKEYQIEKVTSEEMLELFNIHCLGVIRTVQGSLDSLCNSSNPRIINVSSRLGSLTKMSSDEFKDRYFSYSYRIAKASQNMLTVSLYQELRKKGIHVSSIHPGKLTTGTASADADMEASEAARYIFEWVDSLSMRQSGKFVEPNVGDMPW
ncbi:SDR family NAD(P)-dependent oxidoreductase [Bacillus alkalicellulosilyticus]|uniref:SDR family NAD(P)-dependent oxidoreductase n=1 Tax=Alkalihalobacterium alkalicellulosilyticum TaxID=1912214 RepID=UPI00099641AA|nr:SDR family NAD(P)-dependent oxidoreductase [Bacillus alkalicellulosilyticus]